MNDERERLKREEGARAGACPVCGRPPSACEACEGGLEGRIELHEALLDLGGLSVPESSPQALEDTLLACRAAVPFLVERRRTWKKLRLAAAAAVLLAAFLAVLFVFSAVPRAEKPVRLRLASVTLEQAEARIERAFGTAIVLSESARKHAWRKTASLFLTASDPFEAARALADAFGLACADWGGHPVILDRETALREEGSVVRVSMDLSLSLSPDETAELEHIGSELLAVSGPRYTAQVARKARVPYIFEPDRDVPLVSRDDEVFTVSRELPFFRIGRDMKLEFLALAPEDLRRFEALRVLARGGKLYNPATKRALGPLASAPPARAGTARTVGGALEALSEGFDVVAGPGAALELPAPRSLSGADTVGELLHRLCSGRPFYFTWLPDDNLLLVDDRARLQRYLYAALFPLPEGMSPAQLQLKLRTDFGAYFPFDRNRTGDFAVVFRSRVLVRSHIYPIFVLSRSGFFSP